MKKLILSLSSIGIVASAPLIFVSTSVNNNVDTVNKNESVDLKEHISENNLGILENENDETILSATKYLNPKLDINALEVEKVVDGIAQIYPKSANEVYKEVYPGIMVSYEVQQKSSLDSIGLKTNLGGIQDTKEKYILGAVLEQNPMLSPDDVYVDVETISPIGAIICSTPNSKYKGEEYVTFYETEMTGENISDLIADFTFESNEPVGREEVIEQIKIINPNLEWKYLTLEKFDSRAVSMYTDKQIWVLKSNEEKNPHYFGQLWVTNTWQAKGYVREELSQIIDNVVVETDGPVITIEEVKRAAEESAQNNNALQALDWNELEIKEVPNSTKSSAKKTTTFEITPVEGSLHYKGKGTVTNKWVEYITEDIASIAPSFELPNTKTDLTVEQIKIETDKISQKPIQWEYLKLEKVPSEKRAQVIWKISSIDERVYSGETFVTYNYYPDYNQLALNLSAEGYDDYGSGALAPGSNWIYPTHTLFKWSDHADSWEEFIASYSTVEVTGSIGVHLGDPSQWWDYQLVSVNTSEIHKPDPVNGNWNDVLVRGDTHANNSEMRARTYYYHDDNYIYLETAFGHTDDDTTRDGWRYNLSSVSLKSIY